MTYYTVLASDYDGTLAKDGAVDDSTLHALERWRQAGRQLVLITGRKFEDLFQICSCLPLFNWVVAENGAMLYEPATQREKLLGDRPSESFIQQLRERVHAAAQREQTAVSDEMQQVQTQYSLVSHGRIIVSTWEPHSIEAKALIEELGLDIQIILNKGAVMLLPIGVDKAAGIKAVARELATPLDAFVGVGDAENDLPFLQCCGYSVAVANALPEVKTQVSAVTQAERGAGVTELIEQLLLS
ncbi:HAD family hydrolase [Vacuolonema iberomarrocanum]|uniref:HAD family hydrolase n=1 Tax=Vacuolonema iberomarrocanum TaxID=3454632 RepID=UPI001A06E90C|nr:HAD family phosphatase [filamentous cyanobacterium LEGE 07170]